MKDPESSITDIVRTEDGSDTLYVPGLEEYYHSIHGAIRESEYIFINAGLNFCKADPVRVFEAGFGTGLNALLTALKAMEDKREVHYTSIEKFPLSENVISSLNYTDLLHGEAKMIFNRTIVANGIIP